MPGNGTSFAKEKDRFADKVVKMDKVSAVLDNMALGLVTVKPGDLNSLKGLLEEAESLLSITKDDFQHLSPLAEGLKSLIEKIILDEIPSEQGLKALGECIDVLQEILKLKKGDKDYNVNIKRINEIFKGVGIEGSDTKLPETPPLEQDKQLYLDFITEAKEHLDTIEPNIISLEENPRDKDIINAIFRPFHTIKGVSGFLGLDNINRLSHAAENMLDAARDNKFYMDKKAIDVILEVVDCLRAMIDDLAEEGRAGHRFPVDELIKKIETIQEDRPKKIGEILTEKGVVSPEMIKDALAEQKEKPDKKIGEILITKHKVSSKEVTQALKEQRGITPTIKVDTRKLDNLIDMVGELVITQSIIRQNHVLNDIKDQKLVRDLSQLSRITTELQKTSMSLRMVPIEKTFQKMIRLVRDLSKKSGKKVQLIMHGEDTEIDRNMVEELYDPLVHMIRNAIDHGIEMPEDRKEKGKPETGTIELLAYHKGGNIVIEIKDDGQGLNKNKILKKAREKGLVSEEEELSETEIYQLIFKPGFSTAEKVTDVSGRGVGMDVVKKALEKLRGKVEIRTKIGKGTTFIIKLPLTLAIIDGIIVKVGKHRYILPTVAVQEVFRPAEQQYNTYAEKGEMINIRNALFPLVRLHRLFNIEAKYTEPWKALMVIVESEDEKKCLMVDEVLGKQEVVIKSLGEGIGRVKGIAGGAIMGDGKVGLILDVTGIFEMSEQ